MNKERRNILNILKEGGDIERLKYRLQEILKEKPLIFVLSHDEKKEGSSFLFSLIKEKIIEEKLSFKINKKCNDVIFSKISKAHRTKRVVRFNCDESKRGMIFPLIHGEVVYGFLGILFSNDILGEGFDNIIYDFGNLSLEKAIKEIELIRLHNTIRPRAIALSTVHTVHRLISSTLNIDELLPRLARLCLQVLRARYCAIYIEEDKRLRKKAVAMVPGEADNSGVGRSAVKKSSQSGQVVRSPKYISIPLVEEEVMGVIFLREKQNQKPFDANDQEILSVMAEQAIIAIRNARLHENQGKLLWESIKLLGRTLDVKSPKVYTHSMSFLDIVMEIATEYGISDEEKNDLKYATILLDAGKVAVPEEILIKPHKLTKEEYQSVKQHPLRSAEIVSSIKALESVVPIILYHHERYDGKGYPEGLKGEEIPIGARVIAVADTFEAMICERPYRGRISLKNAVEEIEKQSGKQFDPKVVRAFLRAYKKGKIKEVACRIRKEFKKS
jgi:HD-GYP domain-containing protein (c-di-GMP phosphodiesterase class II)